ncbi:MAG: hypothetical protein D6748_14910 [Calditrichaeota bacterium]|nr:MAG: hypothetical protein D6748_14910 [Calditrichota bacterium]
MNKQEKFGHQQFVSIFETSKKFADHPDLQRIRKTDPAMDLLIDILQVIQNRNPISPRKMKIKESIDFSSLEDWLLRIFSGTTTPDEDQRFVDYLLSSPGFYQQVLKKLSTIAPRVEFDPVPEIVSGMVRMKSNEEILEHIMQHAEVSPEVQSARTPQPARLSILEKIQEFLAGFRTPRLAYAIPVLAVLIMVGYFGLQRMMGPEETPFQWDNQVPYAINSIQLRGAEVPLSSSTSHALKTYQQLKDNLTLALGSYLRTDYASMVKTLSEGMPQLLSLQNQLNQIQGELQEVDPTLPTEIQKMIQNYHFYAGIGYMAFSQTKKVTLEEGEREKACQKAIEYLKTAANLAKQFQIETSQRELYFQGLTYLLLKDYQSAREILKNIPPDSPYYSDARSLLQKTDKQ